MSHSQAPAEGLAQIQQARKLQQAGNIADALRVFRGVLARNPGKIALIAECAKLAEQARDWPCAERLYREIGALRPASGFEAPLGSALLMQSRFAEAAAQFLIHLERAPGDIEIRRGLGLACCKLTRWEEALACGRTLEKIAAPAMWLDIMTASLFYLGMGNELDRLLEQAMQRYADNRDLLTICSMHLLKRGEHRRGFALRHSISRRFPKATDTSAAATDIDIAWDGKPFAGLLLVAGEQGLGEEILAARMYPALVAMGQRTVVECEPRLLPVFRRSFPEIRFLPRNEGQLDQIAASGGNYRVIDSLDLPHFLLPQDTLTTTSSWLRADPDRVATIRANYEARWPGRRRIGLSWLSNRRIHGATGKSMPLAALHPLLTHQEAAFISLQYGDVARDMAEFAALPLSLAQPFFDPQVNATNDIDGLLAQLAALDSVITVSNTTAHLAGASGVPCHVLLPHAHPVFWYWGYAGERTPWYPSLRLWRNAPDNDWAALATRIADTALMPDHENEQTLTALVDLAWEARDWVAAERILRRADTLYAGRHRARLALAIFNQQRHADALPLLESLAESGQLDISCALALASCVEHTGDEDRAVRIMRSIYDAIPTDHYAVLLASALLRLGRRGELDTWLPELVAAFPANPQLQAARSEHAFLRGDYATGFDSMTHRWSVTAELPKHPALPCPEWDGIRRDSLLLVTAEQGLGDEILSSSMFEDLVRMGQPALIDCEPRLLPVFSRSFPALRFVDRHGTALTEAASTAGVHKVAALELGRFFRRDSTSLPARASWLLADPARTSALRAMLQQALPGKKLIGLSWRSNRHLLGDSKSIPLVDLEPLLREPDCAFINLQYGDCSADFAQLQNATGLALYSATGIDNTRDIDGLFALVAALDGVVTSSNTTAHVAGALGKPGWLMIPGSRYVLWYWGHEGDRTPWYPSVRLFRGPPRRAWRALAGDVAADLARTQATAP